MAFILRDRLINTDQTITICGMDSHYVTPWVVGTIKFCESRGIIDEIFEHNPMMNDLYPGEKRDILEGFPVISEGDIYLIDFKKNTLKQLSVI